MTDPFSKLPLFATDREIAIAIVGKARAEHWRKHVLPALEGRSFPRVDELHGGRPVPCIRHYYEAYLGVGPQEISSSTADDEDEAGWTQSRRNRRRSK